MGQRGRLAARIAVALLLFPVLTACGRQATGHRAPVRPASLVLDFTPNAIHAGIYTAIARGYDRAERVALHVIVPGASTDAPRLLLAGRADFAILDIHDLAIARARGEPLVGVMAIVERPLASVIAAPAYATPRRLAGRTVGVTGAPSDLAVLRSVLAGAGAAPSSVRTITIGFNAVPDLLAGRVAAATAFWNDEGVTLRHRSAPGHAFHVFRVDAYGAPPYPELVLCATASSVRRRPGLVRAVVGALVRGYRAVLADPGAGERALEHAVAGLSPALVDEQLHAELPAFRAAGGGRVGVLDAGVLRRWAEWERRFGIVRGLPDVRSMFALGFAGS
jgi:ABC-type nitrate/sulfonate/bicarbonate transport system substrate-binding protein